MPDTIPPPAGEESGDDIDVDFEEWATASARLLRRSILDRAHVLREAGLSSRWAEIDEHWYEVLVQDIDAGRLDRLDRYVVLCQRERGHVPAGADEEPASQPESRDEPSLRDGKPLTSVTPPLGSPADSSESIEVDVLDFDRDDGDEDEDDGPSPDDTRVSAAIPESG